MTTSSLSYAELCRLGDICGGMVHEVNNPLTVVSGQAGLLKILLKKEEVDKDKLLERVLKLEESLKSANETLSAAQKLPRSLIDNEKSPHNPNHLLKGLYAMFAYPFKKRDIPIQLNFINNDEEECSVDIYWQVCFFILANILNWTLERTSTDHRENAFLKLTPQIKADQLEIVIESDQKLAPKDYIETLEYEGIKWTKVECEDNKITLTF